MNRNLRILLVLVAAAAAIYFIVVNKPWSTLGGDKKDFAIKDTAAITRIFIADKNGRSVLLTQEASGVWMVDGKYTADPLKINLMKATMHDLEVRNPLPEKDHNSIVAMMANNAVKAEFYKGDKLIKTIYVGSGTPDQTGTYMLIDGASTPYIMHIPGFVGYLSTRFVTNPIKWKSKEVFNASYEEVQSVTVTYPGAPSNSFRIDHSHALPELFDGQGRMVPADTGFVKYYLSGFSKLSFEGYVDEVSTHENDSIRALQPYCIIKLAMRDRAPVTLTVFPKATDKETMQQYDQQGEKLPIDPEKYMAFVNDERDVVYVQHYNFGRVFKTLQDLEKKNAHQSVNQH